ncbi:MAG: DUF2142 domain-containing protein [Clostridia bacterium]|nr:DUF2142 domain-containing protein [Clostridia bacterium]
MTKIAIYGITAVLALVLAFLVPNLMHSAQLPLFCEGASQAEVDLTRDFADSHDADCVPAPEGMQVTATGPDAFHIWDAHGRAVRGLRVTFAQPFAGDVTVQAYYRNAVARYSEELTSAVKLKAGETGAVIPFVMVHPSLIRINVRVDEGTQYVIRAITLDTELLSFFGCMGTVSFWLMLLLGAAVMVLETLAIRRYNSASAEKQHRIRVGVMYALVMVMLLAVMSYYAVNLGGVPDEDCHWSYVLYCNEHPGEIIPDFTQMYQYETADGLHYTVTDEYNYVGHPPLYYRLMSLFSGASVSSDDIAASLLRMRMVNILLTLVTVWLCFYPIGMKRLLARTGRMLPHVLYALGIACIPMVAYVGSGVNNDNLVFLGCTLFLWGLVRYYEGSTSPATYVLVGGGFFTAALSKLTAGEMLGIALVMVVLLDLVQKKGLRVFKTRSFWYTLPLYLLPLCYYGIILMKYHHLQPSPSDFDPNYLASSRFFVEESQRVHLTLPQYMGHFFSNFAHTWSTLYGHEGWVMKEGLRAVFSIGAWSVPVLALCQTIRSWRRGDKFAPMFTALFAALATTVGTQFINCYANYLKRGYLAGYQSRYYICMIAFLSLAFAMFFAGKMQEEASPKWKTALGIALSVLLFAGDFVYYFFNKL